MSGIDEIIHQPVRLRIMSSLLSRGGEEADFTWLKTVLELTDGNLGAHLTTLEKAGYVTIDKSFVDRRPRMRVTPTQAGTDAFQRHVAALQAILKNAGGD